jgi:hypothetical protein
MLRDEKQSQGVSPRDGDGQKRSEMNAASTSNFLPVP